MAAAPLKRTRAALARRSAALVRDVLAQEQAVVDATPPEGLAKLDNALGRPSPALDAASYCESFLNVDAPTRSLLRCACAQPDVVVAR